MDLYLFKNIEKQKYFRTIKSLSKMIAKENCQAAKSHYADLAYILSKNEVADLATMFAQDLLFKNNILADLVIRDNIPSGIARLAKLDIKTFSEIAQADWRARAESICGRSLPELSQLAQKDPASAELKELLINNRSEVFDYLVNFYKTKGVGKLAKYSAFRWSNGLKAIRYPVEYKLSELFGLEDQLAKLEANTSAFLSNKAVQSILLYGPRGSGKSTAVRALLPKYKAAGLKMIELMASDISQLFKLTEVLRHKPNHFLIFIDDLSFNNDGDYGPLKSMLEGSLSKRSKNIIIYATSNRRHIVKEQFSDRPDPLNDDVHGWDTQNEKLALSDRFGLTITFPNPSQRRYLAIVAALAQKEGLSFDKQAAIRFADWGNGYSGRTAKQFIDSLSSGLV